MLKKLMAIILLMISSNQIKGLNTNKVKSEDKDKINEEVNYETNLNNYSSSGQINYYQNQIIYFDNVKVEIKGSISEANLNSFRNEYYSLNNKLKGALNTIIIMDSPLNDVCGLYLNGKIKGCANSDNMILYLDSIYRYGDLLHETIHLYSYQNDRVFSNEFYNCYVNDGNKVTYQENNYHDQYEYFVESYKLYLTNPSYLNSIAPTTFTYFNCL